MKRSKAVLVGLAAVCLLALLAAPAGASLPSILTLSGSEAELSTSGTASGGEIAKWNSTFATFKANSYSITLLGLNMASLGQATVQLKEVTLGGSDCQTSGDAEGVELFNAEWHLVLGAGSLAGQFFYLVLFPKTTLTCNSGIKFNTEGSILERLNSSGDLTGFKLAMECESAGSRKAKWKVYLNDSGAERTASLKANSGLGNEEVCLEVKTELTVLSTEMYEVMEP